MLRGHDKVSGWHRISGRDVQAIFWAAVATTPSRRTARQLLRASLPEQPRQSLFFGQTCALWTNSATSGAAMCTLMSTRRPKHTPPHFQIAVDQRAGPSLGFWSHIEAQIGTQFSAFGSHCRISGVCCRRAKTPTPIRPLSPAGAYRFAPDPVQKSESEKQKERKEKKIGGRMLSFARDEV